MRANLSYRVCDAPEVLQSVEGILDKPSTPVEALVEAEGLFPVAAVGNDGLGSALMQLFARLGAVIGLVAEHVLRWLHSADQTPCDRAVMDFTASQQDGNRRLIIPGPRCREESLSHCRGKKINEF